MRELIIKDIKDDGWLDFDFDRKDSELKKKFKTYEKYLESLSDQELLRTFRRVTIAYERLD